MRFWLENKLTGFGLICGFWEGPMRSTLSGNFAARQWSSRGRRETGMTKACPANIQTFCRVGREQVSGGRTSPSRARRSARAEARPASRAKTGGNCNDLKYPMRTAKIWRPNKFRLDDIFLRTAKICYRPKFRLDDFLAEMRNEITACSC